MLGILTGFTTWMVTDAIVAMRAPDAQLPPLLNWISGMESWILALVGLGYATALAGAFSGLVATEARIARVADLAEDFPDPKTVAGGAQVGDPYGTRESFAGGETLEN